SCHRERAVHFRESNDPNQAKPLLTDPAKLEREPYCHKRPLFRPCTCGTVPPGGDFSCRATPVLSPRRRGGAEKQRGEEKSLVEVFYDARALYVPVAAATKDSSPVRRRGGLRALRRKCRVTEKTESSALPKAGAEPKAERQKGS